MANQPTTGRPWFRLGSMARPAPTPTPEPTPQGQVQPPAPQPRPAFGRPVFTQSFIRPATAQPQEPAPPPSAAASPPRPTTAAAPLSPPPAATTASVPTSPIVKPSTSSSSVQTSPAMKASPSATVLPIPSTTSVPSSPKPVISAPSSSLPTSPAMKASPSATVLPITSTTSVPSSPKPVISAPSSSLPTSPDMKDASPSLTILPITSTSSVPPSPTPKVSAPTSSLPASPVPKAMPFYSVPAPTPFIPKAAPSATITATTARVPTPTPSPKVFKPLAQTPPQPPMIKPAPPPSPLTLPPPQLKSEPQPKIPVEAEQKNVLVQETIEKPKATLKTSNADLQRNAEPRIIQNGKQDVIKDAEMKQKGNHKKFASDSEEVGMRVITLAGENKGAIMELGHSSKKHDIVGNPQSLYKKGNPNARSDGKESGSNNDEGKSKMKDKSHKTMAMPSPPRRAIMNSNVQGVNNSILYNVSCTHHDPGVHFVLSRKPADGREIHPNEHINGHRT